VIALSPGSTQSRGSQPGSLGLLQPAMFLVRRGNGRYIGGITFNGCCSPNRGRRAMPDRPAQVHGRGAFNSHDRMVTLLIGLQDFGLTFGGGIFRGSGAT